jgi:sarcosine oxidase
MGAATAWNLARRGVDTVLVEQFRLGHSLGSSHGRARIFRLGYPDQFYVRLARTALPLWRALETETGTPVLELTGAVDHGEPSSVGAVHRALEEQGVRSELVTPTEAAHRWPGLRFENVALVHPDAGRIDAAAAVSAFAAAARRRGAEVSETEEVVDLRVLDGSGVEVTTSRRTLRADHVVVTAGAWLPRVVGAHVPLPVLRTTQEQPAVFAPTDPATPWPSVLHHPTVATVHAGMPSGVYGLGGPEGFKLGFHAVGRPVDPQDREQDVRRLDDATFDLLRQYARSWAPGVDADSAVPQPCLYTVTEDHDFVVDRVGPVTVAGGFSGHGFKFAPAVGDLVAGLATGVRITPDRFALSRFGATVRTGPGTGGRQEPAPAG